MEDMLLAKIHDWNEDNMLHDILVQLPLLKHISKERMLSEVDPKKVSWFCFV